MIVPFSPSSTDVTPLPNPLVSKLKLIDEKEGWDIIYCNGITVEPDILPKKKTKKSRGRSPQNPPAS